MAGAGTISMECYNNTAAPDAKAEVDMVRLTATRVTSMDYQ
jgi:hypothetical protein